MTVTTTPSVTLHANGVNVDLTSRTLGVQLTYVAFLGQMGELRGTIDLNNTDGALTPGGGGTYSTTNWFEHALLIDAEVTDGVTTHDVALGHGIITGFDIIDDGITSVVRLSIDDAFTVGGQTLTRFYFTGGFNTNIICADVINDAFNDQLGLAPIDGTTAMPNLGAASYDATSTLRSEYNNGVDPLGSAGIGNDQSWDITDFDITSPIKDFLTNVLLSAGPVTVLPTTIAATSSVTTYANTMLGPWQIRRDAAGTVGDGYRFNFVFDEAPGSDELPFRTSRRRYNVDDLTNVSRIITVDTGSGSATLITANSDSVGSYGSRNRDMTSLAVKDPTGVVDDFTGLLSIDSIGQRWANMNADAIYHADTIETSAKLVQGNTPNSVDAWAHLLDVRDGIYQTATINYTPAGSVSQLTAKGVIFGRTIRITPSDINVTLNLYPAGMACGFVLNDSTLGVLNESRLG